MSGLYELAKTETLPFCDTNDTVEHMSTSELISEIQNLPTNEREQIFDFVLRTQRPDWAAPKPPGYFADCYSSDEIEESNWLAALGPKAIVP